MVLFIGTLRHLQAHISQVEKEVAIHREKAPVPQGW